MTGVRIKTAIFGLGRWGKNVARELSSVSDLAAFVTNGSADAAAWAGENIPHARPLSADAVLSEPSIKAIAIATPIPTHEAMVKKALQAGKHVFVEKPLAMASHEADALVELARSRGRVLAVGYIFLYHPLHALLRERTASRNIRMMEITWNKYGTFREPIEWNLLTHHLAVAIDLFGEPRSASLQRGHSVESECDALDAELHYGDRTVISHIDRASTEKTHAVRLTFADGSVEEYAYENSGNPLRDELTTFLGAVQNGSPLPNDGSFGARVVRVHEMLH